jgi:nucleoside-diphosphate-sugar epimerase
MQVLVTGATGFVGSHMIPRLEAAGHSLIVQGSSRLPEAGGNRRVVRTGPFERFERWDSLLDGVDVVVNLAGRSRIASETEHAYRTANEVALRKLMEAMARFGVGRIVHFSSIAARVLADAYGRTKKVGEDIVSDWAARSGGHATILRPPLIYGPGAPGNMARLVKAVRTGLPLPIASVDNRRSLLAAGNAADAVVAAVARPAQGVEIYELCDDEIVSLRDIVLAISAGFGRPAMLLPFPPGLLYRIAALQSPQVAEGLFGDLTLDNRAFRDSHGWSPAVRTAEGLREMGEAARSG